MWVRIKIVKTVQKSDLAICIKSFKKYIPFDAVILLPEFYPKEETERFPEEKIYVQGSLVYNIKTLGDD